jgi:hypothetical protein
MQESHARHQVFDKVEHDFAIQLHSFVVQDGMQATQAHVLLNQKVTMSYQPTPVLTVVP